MNLLLGPSRFNSFVPLQNEGNDKKKGSVKYIYDC